MFSIHQPENQYLVNQTPVSSYRVKTQLEYHKNKVDLPPPWSLCPNSASWMGFPRLECLVIDVTFPLREMLGWSHLICITSKSYHFLFPSDGFLLRGASDSPGCFWCSNMDSLMVSTRASRASATCWLDLSGNVLCIIRIWKEQDGGLSTHSQVILVLLFVNLLKLTIKSCCFLCTLIVVQPLLVFGSLSF